MIYRGPAPGNGQLAVRGDRSSFNLCHFIYFALTVTAEKIANMLGVARHVGVTDFSDQTMIGDAMIDRFGEAEHDQRDDGLCHQMETVADGELLAGQPMKYNSTLGLTILYEKTGGLVSPPMILKVMENQESHHQFKFY